MPNFVRLYHGTSYDNALEIEYRGLLARAYLPSMRGLQHTPTYRMNGYDEHHIAWLTTNKRTAYDYGEAVVEFDIPRQFVTTSMAVNKPVYLDHDTATIRGGGIPTKYVAGIWFNGEFEPKR